MAKRGKNGAKRPKALPSPKSDHRLTTALIVGKDRREFLRIVRETGLETHAAEKLGFTRRAVKLTAEKDEEFAAELEEAMDLATTDMEIEARRRAVEGWDEPVFGSMGTGVGGGQIGVRRQFSDTLLIFLLKARRPETYRERYEMKHDGRIQTLVDVVELARKASE